MRRLATGLLCLLAASACAPHYAPRPSPVLEPGPLPPADRLLQALEVRRAALRSLRCLARVAYRAPGESRRAKQVILAARPDRLRFEVLSPLGAVFVFTAGGGRLAAYARDEAAVYRGTASRENVGRFAAVGVPVTDAVDLLLGTPPVRDQGNRVVSREAGQIKLWQEAGDDVRVTWFATTLDPTRYEEHDAEGRVLVRATYGPYADLDGVRLSTRLSIELPLAQRRVDIELREPEVNPILADAMFALETPAGSREISLDPVVN